MGSARQVVEAVDRGVVDVREEAPAGRRQISPAQFPQLGQDLLGRDAVLRQCVDQEVIRSS